MPGHDIIVIGASAGGVEALSTLVNNLDQKLAAAIFIVLHIPPEAKSFLPQILSRKSPLPIVQAEDRQKIERGKIYVGPGNYHLSLNKGRISLLRGPRENRHRPAIDVLFRSAAEAYGGRVIGVILTGYLDDGTAGLYEIKRRGGIAVVQNPRSAYASAMPENARRHVNVDYCVELSNMSALLTRLVKTPARTIMKPKISPRLKSGLSPEKMDDRFGLPTHFTCPECNGPLWKIRHGPILQFRCHVGHVYSPESLMGDHHDNLEHALWSAIRTSNEHAALLREISERHGDPRFRSQLKRRADQLEKNARFHPQSDSKIIPAAEASQLSQIARKEYFS